MPKVVGLTAVFSSIYGFMMRPFAEHILFYFWKTQTRHFIARKQSSKPNARRKVRNNKHKTNTYLPTFIFIIEFNSLFIFVISLDYVMHLIIYSIKL
jgi:hypothetical protein